MIRIGKRRSAAIGSLALLAALAPAPRSPEGVDDWKSLSRVKVKVAREILAQYREYLVAPPGEKGVPAMLEVAEQIQSWSRQLVDARLDAAADKAERLTILGEEVASAREFEKVVKELVGGGAAGLDQLSARKAEFARLDAEVRLAREKAGR
jgi:hypothetical protein